MYWHQRHGYQMSEAENGQLFDLFIDPGQRQNLIAEQPEKAVELRALLEKIRQQDGSAPRLSELGS